MHSLIVGNKDEPCLDALIYMPDVIEAFNPHICILNRIDTHSYCVIKDNIDQKDSLGIELLYAFISIIKANYPYVKAISLRDASNIPCDRQSNDTLDLLSYNIALYGKSWYEINAGAVLSNKRILDRYNKQIINYMSPSTKKNIPFSNIISIVRTSRNNYALNYINEHFNTYKNMFDTSESFPEFFNKMKTTIEARNKCKFFKDWLEIFVKEYITLERDWIIPIDSNEIIKNVLNVRNKKPMTKRARKSRKNKTKRK